jgi:hypothetical protein
MASRPKLLWFVIDHPWVTVIAVLALIGGAIFLYKLAAALSVVMEF